MSSRDAIRTIRQTAFAQAHSLWHDSSQPDDPYVRVRQELHSLRSQVEAARKQIPEVDEVEGIVNLLITVDECLDLMMNAEAIFRTWLIDDNFYLVLCHMFVRAACLLIRAQCDPQNSKLPEAGRALFFPLILPSKRFNILFDWLMALEERNSIMRSSQAQVCVIAPLKVLAFMQRFLTFKDHGYRCQVLDFSGASTRLVCHQKTMDFIDELVQYTISLHQRRNGDLLTITLALHEEPQCARIAITSPAVITPVQWEMLREFLTRRTSHYEEILQIGGSIAPLTWDEGYGQGVIVRLPWARENE